jgi:hypothetical protein
VLLSRGAVHCNGRLNLSRYRLEEAELINEWIYRLTGAEGRLQASPRSPFGPMLSYDSVATEALVASLGSTWMAQAECLARKFRRPARSNRAVLAQAVPGRRQQPVARATLQRGSGRRVPVLKSQDSPAAASAPAVAA